MKVKVHTETNAPFPPLVGTSWLEETLTVCGGDSRIRKTCIIFGGLGEWRDLGLPDAEILDCYPILAQADLAAARAYYEQHRHEIQDANLKVYP